MKKSAAIVLAVLLLTGCGEVALQRKYVVPIHVYMSGAHDSIAVVNLEIPVDIKKSPDTKPNVPIDLSVPLIPKGVSTVEGFTPPEGTGSLIIIWTAKKAPETK